MEVWSGKDERKNEAEISETYACALQLKGFHSNHFLEKIVL